MRKVQLTLTDQEAEILSIKASQLGYNISKYIRLILSKDIIDSFRNNQIPVFKMSEKAEITVAQGLREYKKGKTKSLKSINGLDRLV